MDITKLKRVLLESTAEGESSEDKILRAVANPGSAGLDLAEVTTITGVRRCGKSTVLQQLKEQAKSNFSVLHIEFDHPELAAFTSDDFGVLYELWLATGLADKKHLLLFDEIHLVDG